MVTKTTEPTLSVQVKQEVTLQRISDLLCSAFEGGSNYWYQIDEFVKPSNFNNSEDPNDIFKHIDYPINEGGSLVISATEDSEDDEPEKFTLNLESIQKGLQVMADKYPSHLQDVINDNDDACTGDVFLQCCLFGEVIFG